MRNGASLLPSCMPKSGLGSLTWGHWLKKVKELFQGSTLEVRLLSHTYTSPGAPASMATLMLRGLFAQLQGRQRAGFLIGSAWLVSIPPFLLDFSLCQVGYVSIFGSKHSVFWIWFYKNIANMYECLLQSWALFPKLSLYYPTSFS